MAILNITYQGQSADYELALDFATSDADIRRIAVEVVRSGGAKGLFLPNLRDRMAAKRIAVCGIGALGSTAVQYLRNVDAELRLIDFDRVESKNLAAQWFVK